MANVTLNQCVPEVGGACAPLAPVPFGVRYPLANRPLKKPSGVAFQASENFPGAYEWMDQDGANLFYSAGLIDSYNGGAMRTASSVVGANTSYTIRMIDGGWLNTDRTLIPRTMFASLGQIPGMWNPVPGISNDLTVTPTAVPFPYTSQNGPITPLLGANNRYSEMSFRNSDDSRYMVFLDMSEMLDSYNVGIIPSSLIYTKNWAADSSGNSNNAFLTGQAAFPSDYFGDLNQYSFQPFVSTPPAPTSLIVNRRQDLTLDNFAEDQSISGKAVYLGPTGAVVVPDNPNSLRFASGAGLTVELWANLIAPPMNGNWVILRKPGSFGIVAAPRNGALGIYAFVYTSNSPQLSGIVSGWIPLQPVQAILSPALNPPLGSTLPSLFSAAPPPVNQWTHIAFSYNNTTGTLLSYVNGQLMDQASSPNGILPILDSNLPVIVGPNGGIPGNSQELGGVPNPPAPSEEIFTELPVQPAYLATVAPSMPYPQLPFAPIMMVDEVKISNLERSSFEIGLSAQRARVDLIPMVYRGNGAGVSNLPAGLSHSDLRVPTSLNAWSANKLQTAQGLGQTLFFDPRLSITGTVSCASCHRPENYFTFPGGLSTGVTGLILPRLAPSLLNRAFSTMQMWDGAASSLESQAMLPLSHANEMGASPESLSQVLQDIPTYNQTFTQLFGAAALSPQHVMASVGLALASFERSPAMMSGNSPADNQPSVSAGQALFFGKARCVACHSGSNFSDDSFHRSVLFNPSGDTGLAGITHRPADLGKFRTPSLRNVAAFTNLMHDGSVTSLAQLVASYNAGPIANDLYPPDPKLRPLNLTAAEQAILVAYLNSLVSAPPQVSAPTSLPAFGANRWIYVFAGGSSPVLTRNCDLQAMSQNIPAMSRSGDSTYVSTVEAGYLYCLVMGRTADVGGLLSHAKVIRSDQTKIRDLVLNSVFSPELLSRTQSASMTPDQFVALMYSLLLVNNPPVPTLANAVTALDRRSPDWREQVVTTIAASTQFTQVNRVLTTAP